eukprot:8838339-Alexandrium_andersonii.AAC.1
MTTSRAQSCPPSLLLPPARRRFGSWNPRASGTPGRSPSAFPAPGRDPGAGGWIKTRGTWPRP